MKKLIIIIIIMALSAVSFAAVKEVSAIGEADILNGDVSEARIKAVARAKWAALEEAAGMKVKADTIIQNAVLVDEAIKTEVQGVVKSYEVTGEQQDGSIYRVMVKAVVEETKAKEAMGVLAKNTSIAVLLPVSFPDGRVEETTALSETVINELITREMEVVDIASTGEGVGASELETAMRNNDYMSLRSLAQKYLSGTILVGKVETSTTASEGSDIGYGVKLPYNVVTGRLTYRLLTEKDGRSVILASGYLPVRGQGSSLADATFRMTENLRDRVAGQLVGIVMEKIKGINNRTVTVRLTGKADLKKLMDLKQVLNYTSWVLEVKEQGMDTLMAVYPEKALYLAAALNSKPKYKVERFSDYEIVVSEVY
ncbi:hypothetical protein [Limisalsivibrio acetivorans]|uniref:hypothetical protein n=1 Tax=Limisalsivibrio acetivorans TaxID=1304888 RepID=UPI0003B6ED64|nr:hypothetical protein [Limisalsivibrio acetivorans]